MLNPTERKALRARAHALDPVIMVGSAGLAPAVLAEIGRALDHHELIKIRVLAADRDEREHMLLDVCQATGAEAIQHLGRMLIVFRPRPLDAPEVPATAAADRPKPSSKGGAREADRAGAPRTVARSGRRTQARATRAPAPTRSARR